MATFSYTWRAHHVSDRSMLLPVLWKPVLSNLAYRLDHSRNRGRILYFFCTEPYREHLSLRLAGNPKPASVLAIYWHLVLDQAWFSCKVKKKQVSIGIAAALLAIGVICWRSSASPEP